MRTHMFKINKIQKFVIVPLIKPRKYIQFHNQEIG